MIPEEQFIESDVIVRHDEGLLYQVEDIRDSTEGWERIQRLAGRVVNYVQLQAGSYPIGTKWSKPEGEFRAHFTVEENPPLSSVTRRDFARNWGSGASGSWRNMYKLALANPDFPLQPTEDDEEVLMGNVDSAIKWLEEYYSNRSSSQRMPTAFYIILKRLAESPNELGEA